MIKITPKNKVLVWVQRYITKIRHGLFLQMIKNRLKKIGLDITPYYLFEESLDAFEKTEISPLSQKYTYEFLNEDDLKTIEKGTSGFQENQWQDYFRSGGKCIGMKHEGNTVAFMWINFKEVRFKSTFLPLKCNEAFVWYLYTAESYRGRNLALYLRYECYEILKAMGCNRLYSINEAFNAPALRFKKKLQHAKKRKLILYIELFNRIHREFLIRKF